MGFFERCAEVKEKISGLKEPLVVGHYDADGISSTAIVALGLCRMGKKFSILTLRKLDGEELEKLKEAREIIFVDLGGGQQEVLEGLRAEKVIIDHHQTEERGILQANPHLFGLDGGTEISAAGVAYFVFHEQEFVELAVVGASGDMQTPLQGLNRKILQEGIGSARVSCERDVKLFGRVSRPLPWFLCYSVDPYLPGLTGDERACSDFIRSLGIKLKDGESWRKYADLGIDEKRTLVTGLVKHLHDNGLGWKAKSLIGEVYSLLKQPRGTELSDASEFSTLLNACGRNKKPELGIAVCMGESEAYEKARRLLALHRKKLRDGIVYANEKLERRDGYYFLDARGAIDDGIVGVIAGMLYKQDMPVMALANDERGKIKVSARATRELVEKGINLGMILKAACEGIGIGGGHKIAAGATVEKENLQEFLERFGEKLRSA